METFKLVVIIIAIAFIALLLILIGLMGENITRLRNQNVELKGEIKQLQERVKELSKYDRKLQRDLKKQEAKNNVER